MERLNVREEVKNWSNEKISNVIKKAVSTDASMKEKWNNIHKEIIEECLLEQINRKAVFVGIETYRVRR